MDPTRLLCNPPSSSRTPFLPPPPSSSSSCHFTIRSKPSSCISQFRPRASPSPASPIFGSFRPRPLPRWSSPSRSDPRRQPLQVQATKKTFSTFDDLLKSSELPLFVDFYATWCGPCQFMVPVLEDVGCMLKDKIRVVKIDTEKYPNIASRYGVQALPTFILFQNGKPIDRLEGALAAPELIKRIQEVLSNSTASVRE